MAYPYVLAYGLPIRSPICVWVGHRPGRARLGMGLRGIGAFAPMSEGSLLDIGPTLSLVQPPLPAAT